MNNKYKYEISNKTRKILRTIFPNDIDTFRELEVKRKVTEFVKDIRSNEEYENIGFKLFTSDNSNKNWKPKEHFTKIFNNEINNAKELYDIKRHEVLFLLSLSEFLEWEVNLLVDDEREPLNQKTLAEKLGLDRKTIKRNMDALEAKLCVYSTSFEGEKYYLVNPNLMYAGSKINLLLPALFNELQYKNAIEPIEEK